MNLLLNMKAAVAALALCTGGAAAAQDGPISILVGFPPGGSTDLVARVMAEPISQFLDRPVVVENRPGAGGRVAAAALKNSKPDGSTYLVMPNASAVFNHLLYSTDTLGYDVLTDMTPVAVFVSGPIGLAVNADLGVDTVEEYVAWIGKNGGTGFFGSAGQGGQTHFSGLAFGKAADVPMTVVPYRGNGPMVTDLIGGQVPAGISVVVDLLPHIASGKLKLLAIFGEERSPLVPDVPTMREAGVDVVAGDAWTGMWARAGTPEADLQRMREAVAQALAKPEVQETFRKASLMPGTLAGAEMKAKLDNELEFWAPIIKESGFKPDQ
ncbi:MAG: Bug family tripartite tricarboxylate transporter substrate binding protein [Pigmentiphaga sp.]